MAKIPQHLRETIARNIMQCRMKKFPGRGGGKRCAEAFGVSPQQWSPWERGIRTPDEQRMELIATFFDTTVEWLRTDHQSPLPEWMTEAPYAKLFPGIPPGAPPVTCTINYQALCQIIDHCADIQSLCVSVLSEGAERTEKILRGRTDDNVLEETDPHS